MSDQHNQASAVAAQRLSTAPRHLLALFLFLFAIYLCSYTPRINSSDGLAMLSTAESLVRYGAFDIEQIRWLDLQQGSYGLDGLLYSRKGVGLPLLLLPLAWVGLVVPWFGVVTVSLLFNAIVTALTALVLLLYLEKLGFNSRTGLIVALTFGLATLAWPYAKSLFSDPLSGLLLLAAAYFLIKIAKDEPPNTPSEAAVAAPARLLTPVIIYAFMAGLCLGWNIATRYAEALFLPIYGLLLLHYLFRRYHLPLDKTHLAASLRHKPLGLAVAAFCLPVLFIGVGLMVFNLSRYGNAFNTGYLPQETFSGIWWDGIMGQLISPGRGLLLYSPVLWLSILGIIPLLRRFRAEALLALSVIVVHLLLYGKWFMWHGGYAWGPRFMVPTLPFWAIFLAPIVYWAFPDKGEQILPGSFTKFQALLLRFIFFTMLILSFIPQLQSVAIDFGPFQDSLLASGLPLFDRQTFFDLQYSPFVAAWPFVTFETLDLVWFWEGQLNSILLLALGLNIVLAGLNLILCWPRNQVENVDNQGTVPDARWKQRSAMIVMIIACCSSVVTLTLLLQQAHNISPGRWQVVISALNHVVQPDDVVITYSPDFAIPFAEQYQGRAKVLGLNGSGSLTPEGVEHLHEIVANHSHIWWLPNWLPPQQNAVEQALRSQAIRTIDDDFNGQRLVLFTTLKASDARAMNSLFEPGIRLLEIATPPVGQPGRAFPVRLQWQTNAPLTEDFHVFLHLLNKDEEIITQADGQPVQGNRPTSTWTVGETISDTYGIWLPSETVPGTYRLAFGLYRPADGQRLLLPDGSDRLVIEVTIEPAVRN